MTTRRRRALRAYQAAPAAVSSWTNEQITVAVVGAVALAAGVGGVVYYLSKPKAVATTPAPAPAPGTPGSVTTTAPPPSTTTPGSPGSPGAPGAPAAPPPHTFVPPSVPFHIKTWHATTVASGRAKVQPGVQYKMSMPLTYFSNYNDALTKMTSLGFTMQGSWDNTVQIPADWPSDDLDPNRWRFLLTYAGSTPVAMPIESDVKIYEYT